VAGKTSPHWENTAKYRIPARRGALHPEILHVTQKPFDIMSVDMLGAIIPKDISICLVVQEIARQIDHFTRELVDFSVALKSPLLSNQDDFATIFDAYESQIHRLSYAVPFMSIIVAFAEKSPGCVTQSISPV
jgi:hypothetical protein